MTMTTKSLTNAQISTLRREALTAGDYLMAAICDLALNGTIDADDYSTLSDREARRLSAMDRDQAYAAIVDAINDAAAQV